MHQTMKTRSFKIPKDTDPAKIEELMKELTNTQSGGVTTPENIIAIMKQVLGIDDEAAKEIMADMLDHEADNCVEFIEGGKGAVSRRGGHEVRLYMTELLEFSAGYPFEDAGMTCRIPIEIGSEGNFQKAEFINKMEETKAGYAASWRIEPTSFVFEAMGPKIAIRQVGGTIPLIEYDNKVTGKVYMDFTDEAAVEISDEEGAPMPLVTLCHPAMDEVQ